MSYSTIGEKPLSQDLDMTKQFAFGLEAMLKQHFSENPPPGDMIAEAILAQAAMITDRLTDIVPLAAEAEAAHQARPHRRAEPRLVSG